MPVVKSKTVLINLSIYKKDKRRLFNHHSILFYWHFYYSVIRVHGPCSTAHSKLFNNNNNTPAVDIYIQRQSSTVTDRTNEY